MSSRAALKQQRREERIRKEREEAARQRRLRNLRIAAAGGGAVVAAVLIALLLVLRSGEGDAQSDPFGAHRAGVGRRMQDAGVPMSNPSMHQHPLLMVYVDGRRIDLPANIGIDPDNPADMAALHTHEPGELVHNEGMPGATLDKFFAIWGVPFSKTQLGPHRNGSGKSVQMWVDGKVSEEFGALGLKDRQRIVVSFGRPSAEPPAT